MSEAYLMQVSLYAYAIARWLIVVCAMPQWLIVDCCIHAAYSNEPCNITVICHRIFPNFFDCCVFYCNPRACLYIKVVAIPSEAY